MWEPGPAAHVQLLQVRGNGQHRDPVDSLVACNISPLKKKVSKAQKSNIGKMKDSLSGSNSALCVYVWWWVGVDFLF